MECDWINDDGQMREFLEHGNGVDIGGVACGGFKGADAALAKHDARVAAADDVFACHEHFFDGGRHAALEKDRRASFANGTQEVEVLHVARAELEDIHIFFHHFDLRNSHHFDNDGQACFLAGFDHVFETFFAETLKGIRRCARFEDAAA